MKTFYYFSPTEPPRCLLCGRPASATWQLRLVQPTETYRQWFVRHASGFIRGPFVRPNAHRTGKPICDHCASIIKEAP